MRNFAAFPRVDLAEAETVFEPPGAGEGHWVGAPSVVRHRGRTYLAVRWRDPDRRGYAIAVYEQTDAGFDERTRLTAEDLGVESVERAALLADPTTDDLKCYLPADRDENDWAILKLGDAATPSGFDPDTARPVLTPEPGAIDDVTVKDPYVCTVGRRYYMFYAGHDGVSEQAHLATSTDGETWTRHPDNPVLGRDGWHDYHTRVSSVLPAPDAPVWLVTYDGSGRDDYGATWNLRTGLAVAADLRAPVDATPDEPVLSSPAAGSTPSSAFGTCRYLDALVDDDALELFVEVAREDGAFELRRTVVPW